MPRLSRAVLAAAIVALPSLAEAQPVTYSTLASQLCFGAAGCNTATQTIGNVVLTFNAIASSTVNANPTTFGTFGEFVVSCVGGGTACGSQSLAGLNLYINIAQTAPTSGNASISGGVIAGSISGTASSATLTWAVPNTVSIGSVTYAVLNNPLGVIPPSVNAGVTSVQGIITNNTPPSVVPEPSTYALMGTGLAMLVGVARRRRECSARA
jgi:hypothetical protein